MARDEFKLRFGSVIFALLTRIVFALHCLIAIGRIYTSVKWENLYWLVLIGLGGLLVEMLVTLYFRKGHEYKWFCPSVFCYLLSIVPCIWILELDMLRERLLKKQELDAGINNITGSQIARKLVKENITLFNFKGISIPITMEPAQVNVIIEQLLLFLLILGRWLLPKGVISRDELSQLLLVYLGMAADIIEFFEAFKEEEVKYNGTLILTILSIWSASLLQFTMVLTASKSKKTRAGFGGRKPQGDKSPILIKEDPEHPKECCPRCTTEVFGILTTMFLQDGPFLSLRLLLIIRYHVRSYMNIFFTVKNTMVLFLMFYRLYVLCFEGPQEEEHKEEYEDLDNLAGPQSDNPDISEQSKDKE